MLSVDDDDDDDDDSNHFPFGGALLIDEVIVWKRFREWVGGHVHV